MYLEDYGIKIYHGRDLTLHFLHGDLHREDGPAVFGPRVKEYWLRGKKHFNFLDYQIALRKLKGGRNVKMG